ncbi:kinase-like domain-containing protein [Gautieria morchelliformis]|nr:kinase-like domain-containing protein [Gautieria morchelliformis]
MSVSQSEYLPDDTGICTSCTQSFQYLSVTSPKCARCVELDSGREASGMQCPKCGKMYACLSDPSRCGYCKRYEDGLACQVNNAVNNPPNPQVDRPSLAPFAFQGPANREVNRADEIILQMHNAHVNALKNVAGDSQNIQKCKIGKKSETWQMGQVTHVATMDQPWKEVVQFFSAEIRQEVTKRLSLLLDEFVVSALWAAVTEPSMEDTYVSKTEAKRGSLRCYGFVILSGTQEYEYHFNKREAKKRGRAQLEGGADSDPEESSSAATHRHKANPRLPLTTRVYQTTIVHGVPTKVTRTTGFLGKDGMATSVTSVETLAVEIGTQVQATGTTKTMYRMTIGADVFAAKSFHFLGSSDAPISIHDNHDQIEHELSRHIIATDIGKLFQVDSSDKEVQVYGHWSAFTFSDSWIATVIEGPQAGWCYLVDPMLPNQSITKFSGAAVAGQNDKSLMGRTMDALAHFSLVISNEALVLVDIQGGIRDTNQLTLFDTMTHMLAGNSGIGDKGVDGINEFKLKHHCNSICRGLGLTPTITTIKNTKKAKLPHANYPKLSPKIALRCSSRLKQAISPRKQTSGPKDSETSLPNNATDSQEWPVYLTSACLDEEGHTIEFHPVTPKQATIHFSNKMTSYHRNDYQFTPCRLLLQGAPEPAEYLAIQVLNQTHFSNHMGLELERFFDLDVLYSQFVAQASAAQVRVAELSWLFEFARVPDANASERLEWLCTPHPKSIVVTENGYDPGNAPVASLIDKTLHAFSHFTCIENEGKVVHTQFSYMSDDENGEKAHVIGATTHDFVTTEGRIISSGGQVSGGGSGTKVVCRR